MRLSSEDKAEITGLREEVSKLRRELRDARTERDEARAEVKVADELVKVKKDLVEARIQQDRLTETNDRERRDIEHKVGLEKRRQEQELVLAKREALVEVRENNLQADRDRFEEQMSFTTKRFEEEAHTQKELMLEILKRLPTVTVEKSIELVGSNGNGRHRDDD